MRDDNYDRSNHMRDKALRRIDVTLICLLTTRSVKSNNHLYKEEQ